MTGILKILSTRKASSSASPVTSSVIRSISSLMISSIPLLAKPRSLSDLSPNRLCFTQSSPWVEIIPLVLPFKTLNNFSQAVTCLPLKSSLSKSSLASWRLLMTKMLPGPRVTVASLCLVTRGSVAQSTSPRLTWSQDCISRQEILIFLKFQRLILSISGGTEILTVCCKNCILFLGNLLFTFKPSELFISFPKSPFPPELPPCGLQRNIP